MSYTIITLFLLIAAFAFFSVLLIGTYYVLRIKFKALKERWALITKKDKYQQIQIMK